MSLALYRKHRPGTFVDLIGQEHVTDPLQQALRTGRTHHAYLFSGPRGCGKTSSARILARSLNCVDGPTPTPCEKCDSCVALAPNGPGSLDVIEIDAASHRGIDDAKDLRERAFFAPVSSRFKIYIIDEAHMVTKEGFNALLKLVEEPPEYLTFVFATTEPDKVLPTIRSRTHHYAFRRVPHRILMQHLAAVCLREGVEVEPAALSLVVRAADGSVRDSLSILDQLIAGAPESGVTHQHAIALLGFTDAQLLDDVVDAFAAYDGATVFAAIDRVIQGGTDPQRFAADLLQRLRDLVILDAVPDAAASGLLDCPPDVLDRMSGQAARMGRPALARAAEIVHTALTEMRGTAAPRLLLELMCARVLLPAAATDDASIVTRLDRLERRLDIAGEGGSPAPPTRSGPAVSARQPSPSASGYGAGQRSATPPPPPWDEPPATERPAASSERPAASAERPAPRYERPAAPAAAPVEQAPAAHAPAPGTSWPDAAALGGRPEAPGQPSAAHTAAAAAEGVAGLDAGAVRRVWPDVMEAVRRRRRTTHALLDNAQVIGVEGRLLTLSFTTAPLARQFKAGANEEPLREALREVLGGDWHLDVQLDGARPAGSPSAIEDLAPGDDYVEDEPTDDPTAPAKSQEEVALAAVRDTLGAKVIGEIDAS